MSAWWNRQWSGAAQRCALVMLLAYVSGLLAARGWWGLVPMFVAGLLVPGLGYVIVRAASLPSDHPVVMAERRRRAIRALGRLR